MRQKIPPDHWQRARDLRQPLTTAERKLWQVVRGNQLGVTFRRQHPIGPFVVDFVALDARLIIEIDGSIHTLPDVAERDNARQEYLEAHGYAVKRYANQDVMARLPSVIADIVRALEKA